MTSIYLIDTQSNNPLQSFITYEEAYDYFVQTYCIPYMQSHPRHEQLLRYKTDNERLAIFKIAISPTPNNCNNDNFLSEKGLNNLQIC